jgi:hypothetical protein
MMKKCFVPFCIILSSIIFSCTPSSKKVLEIVNIPTDTIYQKDSALLQPTTQLETFDKEEYLEAEL